jgi:hypothetical protein
MAGPGGAARGVVVADSRNACDRRGAPPIRRHAVRAMLATRAAGLLIAQARGGDQSDRGRPKPDMPFCFTG